MSRRYVHTCLRVRDPEASVRFYGALGFEPRGRLNFESAYNLYMGLPGDGDVLELTVNRGHEEPYDLGTGYNHMAVTVDDIEAALAELEPLGVAAREAPVPPGRARGAAADRLRRRPGRLPDRADRRRRLRHAAGPGGLAALDPRPGDDVVAAVGPAHPGLVAAVVVVAEQDQRRRLAERGARLRALLVEPAPDPHEAVVLELVGDGRRIGVAGPDRRSRAGARAARP